jgi:hypothetical protein
MTGMPHALHILFFYVYRHPNFNKSKTCLMGRREYKNPDFSTLLFFHKSITEPLSCSIRLGILFATASYPKYVLLEI